MSCGARPAVGLPTERWAAKARIGLLGTMTITIVSLSLGDRALRVPDVHAAVNRVPTSEAKIQGYPTAGPLLGVPVERLVMRPQSRPARSSRMVEGWLGRLR